ncbi:hypothetical protein HELRODRAFT_167117 [Helobdella robusta]|uniref:Uncharacterized protein n=1 Tax=Helobdella robusta TaxID=6412 RepID=T1EZ15_HELRO|nr:hypothetical protein HELRODRAFT_167117 [Helobdella robusta]ESO10611.1 hypothetical protein HELRODRAFT_167117 [Helobdella robusta]
MELYTMAMKKEVEFVIFAYGNLMCDTRCCVLPAKSVKDFKPDRALFTPGLVYHINPHQCHYSLIPDVSTFTILPWKKNFAWVQCHLWATIQTSPRKILPMAILFVDPFKPPISEWRH